MQGAGVYDGDILIVGRSENPINGSMIIAALDGDCLVKVFNRDKQSIWLCSANPQFPDICVTEDHNFQVWGVVISVVRY